MLYWQNFRKHYKPLIRTLTPIKATIHNPKYTNKAAISLLVLNHIYNIAFLHFTSILCIIIYTTQIWPFVLQIEIAWIISVSICLERKPDRHEITPKPKANVVGHTSMDNGPISQTHDQKNHPYIWMW